MDYWSIMDYGQYYFNGYAPPGYTAYERSFMGWLRVTELSEAQTGVKLYAFGQEELGEAVRHPKSGMPLRVLSARKPPNRHLVSQTYGHGYARHPRRL